MVLGDPARRDRVPDGGQAPVLRTVHGARPESTIAHRHPSGRLDHRGRCRRGPMTARVDESTQTSRSKGDSDVRRHADLQPAARQGSAAGSRRLAWRLGRRRRTDRGRRRARPRDDGPVGRRSRSPWSRSSPVSPGWAFGSPPARRRCSSRPIGTPSPGLPTRRSASPADPPPSTADLPPGSAVVPCPSPARHARARGRTMVGEP